MSHKLFDLIHDPEWKESGYPVTKFDGDDNINAERLIESGQAEWVNNCLGQCLKAKD